MNFLKKQKSEKKDYQSDQIPHEEPKKEEVEVECEAQKDKGEVKKQTTTEMLVNQYNKAKLMVSQNANDAKAQFKKAESYIGNVINDKKKKIDKWIKKQVESRVIEFIEKCRPRVKRYLKDEEHMPKYIQGIVDSCVDECYPHLIEEAKYQLRLRMHKPRVNFDKYNKNVSSFCLPFHKIRTWYNYSSNPADKSTWAQSKSFSYWLISIISFIPFFGIQQALYLFGFICMDKEDEYQLVNYILDYKKQQFFGQGLIAIFTIYLSQYYCMRTWDNLSIKNPIYECVYGSPSSPMLDFYLDLVDFTSQLLLIWIAFFLLPCSVSKGKADFSDLEQQQTNQNKNNQFQQQQINEKEGEHNELDNSYDILEDKENQNMNNNEKQSYCKGGKLYIFMIYDILAFILASAAYYYSESSVVPKEYHQSSAQFTVAKLVYGGLSFPFIIFRIGYMTGLITKARYTAYDQYGNTVPCKLIVDYNPINPDERIEMSEIKTDKIEFEEKIETQLEQQIDQDYQKKKES